MGAIKSVTGEAIVRTPQRVIEAIRLYSELYGTMVEAGFPGELRDVKAEAGEKPSPPSVLQVATWNEYGTDTAPPRPFMRQAITRHKQVLSATMAKVVKGYANKREKNRDAMFVRIGVMLRGAIQETIRHGEFPDNADLTKMIKGSRPRKTFLEAVKALRAKDPEPVPQGTRPLIDTGQMRQSVRWRVRRAGRIVAESGGGGR